MAGLCACANLLATPIAAAEDQPEAPAAGDQPIPAAAAAEDKSDVPTLVLEDHPDPPAMAAWFGCSTQATAQLDDGRSDAGTIADALTTSCQPEWDASKAEQCKASELAPDACAMLSDKLDANRRSYEIKVVLTFRARKAQAAAP